MIKLRYICYVLFSIVPFSYGNTNSLLVEEKSEKVMLQNELTEQEKIELKNAIMGTIKVISDNDAMEEQAKFFGEDTLYAPKSPKAPIVDLIFQKDNLFRVNFIRKAESSPWNEASIYFPFIKLSSIETRFNEQDFNNVMGLAFDKISEHIIQHSASNGMEAYETKEFTFDYHYKLNNKIKVIFNVRPEDLLRNEKFPSNFIDVKVYYEN